MRQIGLDARLMGIAQMLGKCDCVADIGTDHGRLGAYLLQRDLCGRVQFLDVSSDSLDKARALIARMGLLERASFGVGDGAAAMTEDADGVVIAGMGGQLIAQIVERGIARLRGAKLVLQPNVAQRLLRQRLSQLGFMIEEERLVKAGRRYYIMMGAAAGEAQYTEQELIVGPKLLAERPALLKEYARRQLDITKGALAGAMVGGAAWADELHAEVEAWEAIVDESGEG